MSYSFNLGGPLVVFWLIFSPLFVSFRCHGASGLSLLMK